MVFVGFFFESKEQRAKIKDKRQSKCANVLMCQYANEEIKAKVKKVKGQKSSYPSFLSIINSLSIPKAFGTNLQSLRTRNGKQRLSGDKPKAS